MKCLSRLGIAHRISREFQDGEVVNLGTGIPSMCADFAEDRGEVLLHSEQGLLGFGRRARFEGEVNPQLLNASRQPVTPKAGMCLMDHAESFALIRGGRIDIAVLAAIQVSVDGDLANCWLPGAAAGGLGGAQDLAFRARRVIAALPLIPHAPRLVKKLSLEMTCPKCVTCIVSELGVVYLNRGRATLTELVDGWSVSDVQQLVEVDLAIPAQGPARMDVPDWMPELWTVAQER